MHDPEGPVEVGQVVIADRAADFGYGHIRPYEQFARLACAQSAHMARECVAGLCLEEPRERSLGHPGDLRDLGQANACRQVLGQVLGDGRKDSARIYVENRVKIE